MDVLEFIELMFLNYVSEMGKTFVHSQGHLGANTLDHIKSLVGAKKGLWNSEFS